MMKIIVLGVLIIIYFLPSGLAEVKTLLLSVISILWTCLIIFFIMQQQKIKNLKNKRQKHLFIKDLPSVRTPLELGYLLKGKIDSTMLSTSIMELIRKKALLLRYNPKKKDYIFMYNTKCVEEITNSERDLMTWFLRKIGDGEKVSLSRIKKEATTNSVYFINCYNDWHTIASFEGTKTNYFDTKKSMVELSLTVIGLGAIMAIMSIILHVQIYITTILLATIFILILYINKYYLRTKEGNDEYSKWISLSHSIKKGDACNNITDLASISRLIVYSKSLNVKVDKTLHCILENTSHVFDNDEFVMYARSGIFDELCSKINRLVPTALTMSFVFIKNHGSRSETRYKRNKEEV